ncbi:MAG: Alcohol dehydrogenase [acceptor], partial [Alphaproteobacteria bacterium MarineAlpha5_Bin8]
MNETTDYIVVGGGASGCAVTNKLLKNNSRVTLFEAGYSHHNFLLDVPAGFFKLINDSKYATYHKTTHQQHLFNRQNIIPQGNVLGGGTSINSQVYMRGRPQDFSEWQNILRVNNDYIGWSWQDVLPYFKEMENNSNIKNEYHGKTGPLKVSNSSYVNELSNDFVKTVHDLGIPLTNDFNGKEQKGVGLYQFMNSKGKRSS